MGFVLRLVLGIACLVFLVYVVIKVAQKKLLLRYSLLWLALAVILLICSLWPDPIYAASSLLGFIAPSNFVFALALLFVIAIALSQSMVISKQSRKLTRLTQELALLNKTLEEESSPKPNDSEDA